MNQRCCVANRFWPTEAVQQAVGAATTLFVLSPSQEMVHGSNAQVLILEQLQFDMIIGNDLLSTHGALIDFGSNT